MQKRSGRIDGCFILFVVVVVGLLAFVISNLFGDNPPNTSEEFAAEHEETMASAAVMSDQSLQKKQILELLQQARPQGGVIDLGNGHALVRFKIGAQFHSAAEAFEDLRKSADAWAQTCKVEIVHREQLGGHT